MHSGLNLDTGKTRTDKLTTQKVEWKLQPEIPENEPSKKRVEVHCNFWKSGSLKNHCTVARIWTLKTHADNAKRAIEALTRKFRTFFRQGGNPTEKTDGANLGGIFPLSVDEMRVDRGHSKKQSKLRFEANSNPKLNTKP